MTISETRWAQLRHAYGAAADIPPLLEQARTDMRPAGNSDSAWFDLWSSLCHQGDAYTASYAAAAELVEIAKERQGRDRYDALCLVGCIELARLEGRAPAVPDDLLTGYESARREAASMIEALLTTELDDEWRVALSADLASFRGDRVKARALLDAE